MAMTTPDWILKGYDSKVDWEKAKGIASNKKKGKTFNVRECPKCRSNDVGIVLGGKEGDGSKGWECHKCKWSGKDVKEQELTEDEFMKYLDDKGEEVA